MLFDAFKSRKSSKNSFINPNPTWRVAWGEVDASYEDIAWRDEKFVPLVWHGDRLREYLYSQASYLNRLMVMNIKFKGADQILTKVSNLTQA